MLYLVVINKKRNINNDLANLPSHDMQIVSLIRLLCFLPIIVCVVADSVVHQVALLPSNNSLQHNEQYCTSGHYAPFVMNIEWDYNYYKPWSDNEWLVDEMLAMLDEDIIM